MASDSTTPPAPAMPCRKRKMIRAPMSGAAAQATDSTVNATRPASSGRLRPRESLNGPATSCPTARPARQPDSVSCTSDCEACRLAAIVGVDGRYMSIESGPNEDSAPSTASIPIRRCRLTTGATKVSIVNESYVRFTQHLAGWLWQRAWSHRGDRLAARQQDAVHHPALALVVVDREVPGLPVVPHRDRAGRPVEAGRELRPHPEVEQVRGPRIPPRP